MFKLDLEKAKEPEAKLPTFVGSQKKQENSRKNFCFTDYAKDIDCVDHNKLWKTLKEMGRTGKPGMLQSMALQRVGHNLATEQQGLLNMANLYSIF